MIFHTQRIVFNYDLCFLVIFQTWWVVFSYVFCSFACDIPDTMSRLRPISPLPCALTPASGPGTRAVNDYDYICHTSSEAGSDSTPTCMSLEQSVSAHSTGYVARDSDGHALDAPVGSAGGGQKSRKPGELASPPPFCPFPSSRDPDYLTPIAEFVLHTPTCLDTGGPSKTAHK